ncbi:N-formylglutamate amidohydrolase [Legionella cardiaca]|uniref:N-formylglutamate amidohydrolase n=1 Tax=Legionella cardiaca TaxID=1071983 RepID=A0ABY8APD7_9GAMM|nr:N-formylglutamate amidohydrolase [Legionella cardiaca]WED42573.1 N-formylglutamate amidohydrolase [Legionella cardiaca]
MKPWVLVLSCEHAVNTVPPVYRKYFQGHEELLHTHRGIDFGAQAVAKHLSTVFNCDFVQAQATRLLIDCNRRLTNPDCFSEITSPLSITVKQAIIQAYYVPFREKVINLISKYIKEGYQVWHLSIHSFTPIMNNLIRNADIGLLYDPRRLGERQLAKQWQLHLKQQHPDLRIRLNYPYRGITDGFTSFLRMQFNEHDYLGFEVENNQALMGDSQSVKHIADVLASTLKLLLVR